jgi:hypothetical protein
MVANMGTEATSDLRIPLRYFYAVAALGAVAAAILAAKRILRLYADSEARSDDAAGTAHG